MAGPRQHKTRSPKKINAHVCDPRVKGMESMATLPAETPKFRIDVAVNDLLTRSYAPPAAPIDRGLTLPAAAFPQHPDKLKDPGPATPPESRKTTAGQVKRAVRGWLVPYLRSRVLPGDFHPITAYLFVEYKCNLDCWYCPSFDNTVKGMS